MSMRRSKRLVALVAGLALVAAACGGDDDDDTATTDAPSEETSGAETTTAETSGSETTTAETSATTEEGGETTEGGEAPAGDVAMTVTVDINPDAVWEDGSPITWEDFECTWQAQLNTPGSIETAGYELISSVEQGESEQQVVFNYTQPYAAVQDAVRRDHQEGGRRRLQRHLHRLQHRAADLGPAVHDQLVRRERDGADAEPELVG